MADLAELFARLKNPNTGASSPASSGLHRPSDSLSHQTSGYQPPTVSSPIVSPPPSGARPRHPEHVLSASATPLPGTPAPGDPGRAAQNISLLNILNAGGSAASESGARPHRQSEAATPTSAADLVASFARHGAPAARPGEPHGPARALSYSSPKPPGTQSSNPQDMLLTLLKRSDNGSQDLSPASKPDVALDRASADTNGASAQASNSKLPIFPQLNPFSSIVPTEADAATMHDEELAAEQAANQELKEVVQEVAAEISEELRDGKTRHEVEEQIAIPVSEALREATATPNNNDDVADNWETAESDEAAKANGVGHTVQVFNLPMRPFVSLEVSGATAQPSNVRPDVVMKIASLKKSFDQIDRTLATASQNHIVYAISKGGGFRVIRQDDGSNKTAYRQAENQIFNISINSSPDSDVETVLATGVNGTVFWSAVPVRGDISVDDMEKRSFVFPPPPSADENTSTAQLKTRAKKSSRHPAFFAYGRSKTIYLVWPVVAQGEMYMDKKTRVVDSVKYLNERCVRIATGKAGKDFCFSEDDTVIVSLDKHGKLKFWDVAEHVHPELEYRFQDHVPHEVKEPIMTLWASSSSTKAWPTSVHFVDKERPTAKGLALRYLIVGMKQNHTIQLWDLGLGKAVQEINLPHENETDAICSISYHSKSGIIAVGHPTRNSLYLIHLSAPKYNLPQLSQAKYMSALAATNRQLPRPDSTAIMSGLREISLSTIGNLRSIDVISPSPPTAEDHDPDEDTVFEVYMMHSKGVTCLSMKKRDLGWGSDGKVVNAKDAEREKIVAVSELQVRTPAESAESSETPSKPVEPIPKPLPKATVAKKEPEAKPITTSLPPPRPVPVPVTVDKPKAESVPAQIPSKDITDAKTTARDVMPEMSAKKEPVPEPAMTNGRNGMLPTQVLDVGIDSKQFSEILSEQMQSLYRRIDQDRRVMDASGSARHEAVLRLVSSTLTDNVEKSLSSIVSDSIKNTVLPSLAQITATTVDQKLGQVMSQQFGQAVPRELQAMLPEALSKALSTPKVADAIASKVSHALEKSLSASIQGQVAVALESVAASSSSNAFKQAQKRMDEHMLLVRQQDAAKMDQLSLAVGEMTATLTSMATIQAELQREIILLREQTGQQPSVAVAAIPTAVPVKEANPELEAIVNDVEQGRIEQGTIRWLQSSDPEMVFREYFRKMDPIFLRGLSQIVVLSVAAAVTSTLNESYLGERLSWLEVSLGTVDAQSPEIAELTPKMMDVLISRLQEEYMSLSDKGMTSQAVLSRIHTLVRRAKEIKVSTGA